MAYFQGGDFIELLSAQGKAPAAAWRVQGKVTKVFDKRIKGNVFLLDGNAETKMQLPKTASSSLGVTQRFAIAQLLVPFTRSFSIEMCFSDFQKGRRRFVIASAFRDVARTTLHVQLPLNASGLPRDQWINLVFDLQTLAALHFPDTDFRSLESISVSGSCRLKRIFTMKDAPTPSRSSQIVRHADTREIPKQFVFSTTKRENGGANAIATLYFADSASNLNRIQGVSFPASKATETTIQRARKAQPMRLASRVRQQTNGSKSRMRTPALDAMQRAQVKLDKGSNAQHENHLDGNGLLSQECDLSTGRDEGCVKNNSEGLLQPQGTKLCETQDEEPISTTPPERSSGSESNRSISAHATAEKSDDFTKDCQLEIDTHILRRSIMGDIQQKIANLEAQDEQADERDQELFLQHTSIHSGEWHLQQLRDEELNGENLLSDGEDDDGQLSSSWRRESHESNANETMSPQSIIKKKPSAFAYSDMNKPSIFSFSSSIEPTILPTRTNSSKLFDFNSLLQDLKPLNSHQEQANTNIEADSQRERCGERNLSNKDDVDDLELSKLLAAKRSERQLLSQNRTTNREDAVQVLEDRTQSPLTSDEDNLEKTEDAKQVLTSSFSTQSTGNEDNSHTSIGVDPTQVKCANGIDNTGQDDFDLDLEDDLNDLSMDLTSELSASAKDDVEKVGPENTEDCIGPAICHMDEIKPESDASENDDQDSSFDFEDLVDNVELIDSRDEDEAKNTQSIAISSPQEDSACKSSTSDSNSYEKRKGPPVPPRRIKPITSPILKFPHPFRDNQEQSVKPLRSTTSTSSLSSRRLHSLLESTDWTAELNAQKSDPSGLASPNGIYRSTPSNPIRHSRQKSSPRLRTPSTSSVELVYDPILRCYYDPVANKYYALAE